VQRTLAESHKQWFIPFAVQLIPAGVLVIGLLFADESPRWMMFNGKREKGLRILSRLRNLPLDHQYMREEIAQIDQAIEIQEATIGNGFLAPLRECRRNRSVQWRLFLGGSLFFWQNGSGINAINYYSPTVFQSIGVTGTSSSLLSTGIFGVIKTVMTFVWILVMIDQLGRRNLLLIGALGGSISMWIVGAYVAIAKPSQHVGGSSTAGGRAAIAFFYIYTFFYTPSWSGTPWVINSEMFDQNMRSLGQAFAAANNWLWNFIVARFTPQMFDKMGYGVWFFFAALQILSIPFVYFLIPETKSVPLEQMDLLFSQNLKPWKAHKEVMRNLREMEEVNRANAQAMDSDKSNTTHLEGV
jgi:sugar porter (SP) family MFS transporter